MRTLTLLLLLLFAGMRAYAQNNETEVQHGKWEYGLFAGLNSSQLSVVSSTGPSVKSSSQWSAGFGIFCKSPRIGKFRWEAQLASESTGGDKLVWYETADGNWLRIYDRYRTVPLTVLINRFIGVKEKWSLGLGFKSSIVVQYTVRHDNVFPGPSSGLILSPRVQRWFGSPVVQLSHHFPYADVTLSGWYALTPLINEHATTVAPYGVSFVVKVRLFTMEPRSNR